MRMRHGFRTLLCMAALGIGSMALPGCSPLTGFRALTEADIEPPLLLFGTTVSEQLFLLRFSEPVYAIPDSFSCTLQDASGEAVKTVSIDEDGEEISFMLDRPLPPGEKGILQGAVEDAAKNSLYFTISLYGYNDRVPKVLINEFTPQGSSAHPDRVELLVLESGDTAGMVFYDGVAGNYRQLLQLPSLEVSPGDMIVIHCADEGGNQSNEKVSMTESIAASAADTAWDLWIDDAVGLSGNNGVLSLYTAVGGELADAVLYSNRTSSSDERYQGFGSRALAERVELLNEQLGWKPQSRDDNRTQSDMPLLRPEDAVNPEDSTATRSICRRDPVQCGDSDTKDDWYIVPTRSASFGAPNCTEEYQGIQ